MAEPLESQIAQSGSFPRIIADGLSMPTPERQWFEQWSVGNIGCVNCCIAVWENSRETLAILGKWRRTLAENADLVAAATSVEEIREVAASGRTAVVFGFQNTAPIEHDIELFGQFRALGICIMQLTYNLQNNIGCGYWEKVDSGISSCFGNLAIEEMNRVGIMIDLSHCGEQTTLDAIRLSQRPVAITHANPREYVGTPVYGAGRLKTTEAIKLLGARKGVIGLTPNRNMTQNGANTTLKQFCDMVAWTVDLIGIDSVAIGLDYCPGHPNSIRNGWRYARWSRESAPADQMVLKPHEGWSDWISSPAKIGNIGEGLLGRGFNQSEVDAIMGGNWLRVYKNCFSPDN